MPNFWTTIGTAVLLFAFFDLKKNIKLGAVFNRMASSFVIRNASRIELDLLMDWANLEGWNTGKYDAEAFFKTDPDGYFIGLLNGVPIGTISGVKLSDEYGFVGFYIVKPEYRGKGFGVQLFRKAMEYLGDRNVALDAVPEQQENYTKSKFALVYDHVRYTKKGRKSDKEDEKHTIQNTMISSIPHSIVSAKDVHFETLLAYDTLHVGFERRSFLSSWLDLPENHSICVVEQTTIKGFGCIRPATDGYRIGPLFADSTEYASTLLAKFLSTVSVEHSVYVDIPDTNPSSLQLFSDNGFTYKYACGRMYTKGAPQSVPMNEVFAIATLELG